MHGGTCAALQPTAGPIYTSRLGGTRPTRRTVFCDLPPGRFLETARS